MAVSSDGVSADDEELDLTSNAALDEFDEGLRWAMRDVNDRPLPCERSDPEPGRTSADEDGSDSNDPDDDEPPANVSVEAHEHGAKRS